MRVYQFRHVGTGTAFVSEDSVWCPRRDSNPHTSRHMDLNHARLPIPPRGHCRVVLQRGTHSNGRMPKRQDIYESLLEWPRRRAVITSMPAPSMAQPDGSGTAATFQS